MIIETYGNFDNTINDITDADEIAFVNRQTQRVHARMEKRLKQIVKDYEDTVFVVWRIVKDFDHLCLWVYLDPADEEEVEMVYF